MQRPPTDTRTGSITFTSRDPKALMKTSLTLYQVAFLGKIYMKRVNFFLNNIVLYDSYKIIAMYLLFYEQFISKCLISALKIMTICFETELRTEWRVILRAMRLLNKRNEASTYLWNFIEFIVTHRTALYIQMLPFIVYKIGQAPISEHERNMHTIIREKINGSSTTVPKSRGTLLMDLIHELKNLKQEIENRKCG